MTDPDDPKTLAELVARVQNHLNAGCALVTQVTSDQQIVLAHAGMPLPEPFATAAPLDYSICQHSVAMDFPLAIDDTLSHPLMRGNLAVSQFNIAAYIGAPVHVWRGEATGAICAIEFHQRRWTEEDIRYITDAARIADGLIVKLF